MNELERQLQYPQGETLPEPGRTIELAPGVRWVRMGLPFALDHINLWLLRDRLDGREGWTIVDCGITNADTQANWEKVFETELDGLPVLRLVVTHMHPDHIGLAHWLTERWGTPDHECRLWMSATDYTSACLASRSTTGHGGPAAAAFMASHGLTDPDAIEKIKARSNYYGSMVPQVPASYRRLLDGSEITIGGHVWRCIAGYGHAPEHLSLHSETLGVLISGDMLLPRISTNVSVSDLEPEANSLTLYLQSIDRYRALPADTLVLPSHGRPFKGMHTRVDQLHAHHDERLADVMTECAKEPQTAASLLKVLFRRPLDLHQTTFAMGESIAHLNALWIDGKLRRERGADGVLRFSVA
ncbi:MBL fold metallo-hydrolase [Piscinibacter gummiphilus]|uniref:Zn-dependent hydrolase n=1 Tax=Piscinibacter gummiphilus TaxID=946333 RepID=A0A1W6LFI7_9BURK|nr:MBL fold metallo-hydrolase [Piscinibacter gummiphilus]ARN22983.1 Zn-dependent hydrolase [Piscinibacter gummiphilus]ATU67683.1 Zn-dependent hydrolase [Piscinibacter gummiphilus]GLS96817.1 Zn-dependent hydrolase [Piscinibacter gummiphilus]